MGINDGWAMDVQEKFAVDLYEQFWDGCDVVEADSLGAEESVAQILDYGDVDKIIWMPGQQIHMAQRFRKPYWDSRRSEWADPDFTLRYSRPTSDHRIEYDRLMAAADDEAAAYPKRYAFGRVYNDHTKGLYELYIIDTDRLIDGINAGTIPERGPITTEEGQTFKAYDIEDIEAAGGVVKHWHRHPTTPDEKEDITAWCAGGSMRSPNGGEPHP